MQSTSVRQDEILKEDTSINRFVIKRMPVVIQLTHGINPLSGNAPWCVLCILLCLMRDNFTGKIESVVTQWVKAQEPALPE
jgi:hypothetical protein